MTLNEIAKELLACEKRETELRDYRKALMREFKERHADLDTLLGRFVDGEGVVVCNGRHFWHRDGVLGEPCLVEEISGLAELSESGFLNRGTKTISIP